MLDDADVFELQEPCLTIVSVDIQRDNVFYNYAFLRHHENYAAQLLMNPKLHFTTYKSEFLPNPQENLPVQYPLFTLYRAISEKNSLLSSTKASQFKQTYKDLEDIQLVRKLKSAKW